jgi:hypothetical protein
VFSFVSSPPSFTTHMSISPDPFLSHWIPICTEHSFNSRLCAPASAARRSASRSSEPAGFTPRRAT